MKNLAFAQRFTLITILLICALLLFLFWNKQSSSSKTRDIRKINSTVSVRKLLIATQGSPFKDSITAEVSDRYKTPSVIVEVIDIRVLTNINTADFDAILIIHRWEAGAPYESVQFFMDKNLKLKNKIVMLTTSWDGLEKMENIDAITGASIVKDVPIFTDKIFKKLDQLLEYNN